MIALGFFEPAIERFPGEALRERTARGACSKGTTSDDRAVLDARNSHASSPIFRSSHRTDLARKAFGLSRLRCNLAETAVRHRRARRLLRRTTTPTSTAACTKSPRALPNAFEARARESRAVPQRRRSAEIIWTRNTTEAINLVSYAWGLQQYQGRRRHSHLRDSSTTRISSPGSCLPRKPAPSCASSRSTGTGVHVLDDLDQLLQGVQARRALARQQHAWDDRAA